MSEDTRDRELLDLLQRLPDTIDSVSSHDLDDSDDPDPDLANPSAPSAIDVSPAAFDRLPDPFADVHAPTKNETKSYIKLQNVTPSRERALSQRQLLALPIIAAAPNLSDGAANAGISRMTLYRWLQDDDFRAQYNRVRNEIAFLAMQEVKAAMLDAAATLRDCCRHPNGLVRVRAAHSLLMFGNRQLQSEKLESDLDDLQQSLENMQKRQSQS